MVEAVGEMSTMGLEGGAMRELLTRWIEESQRLVGVFLAFLEEHDRVQYQADMAQRECERLREETRQLRFEKENSRRERAEIADSLSDFMKEVLPRLHPPTALAPESPRVLAELSRMGQGRWFG